MPPRLVLYGVHSAPAAVQRRALRPYDGPDVPDVHRGVQLRRRIRLRYRTLGSVVHVVPGWFLLHRWFCWRAFLRRGALGWHPPHVVNVFRHLLV